MSTPPETQTSPERLASAKGEPLGRIRSIGTPSLRVSLSRWSWQWFGWHFRWVADLRWTNLLTFPLLVWAFWELIDARSFSDGESIKFLSEQFLPFATGGAVLVGLIVAPWKVRIFRYLKPHLTLKHEVSHRPITALYGHMTVKVELRNDSRVLTHISKATYHLYQVAPSKDTKMANDYLAESGGNVRENAIKWPRISTVQGPVPRPPDVMGQEVKLTVEPGEAHQETIEFIVPVNVKTVLIYTYFEDKKRRSAWDARTAYDIRPAAQIEASAT